MIKDKIAISVDPTLLKQLDAQIDGSMIRSRSQAIEYYLKRGLQEQSITDAVLLLHKSQQDVALGTYNGRALILQQIDFFLSQGITQLYLITQQPKQELRELLVDKPVRIIDNAAKGNAFALQSLRDTIHRSFVTMSGDTFNKFDLLKLINKHQQQNKLATMGLMTREKSDNYGTAILDGDLIIDFSEKKSSSSHIVNAGIYVFKPEIFELIDKSSLERDLFPKLAKIKELVGFFTYGEYEHFG